MKRPLASADLIPFEHVWNVPKRQIWQYIRCKGSCYIEHLSTFEVEFVLYNSINQMTILGVQVDLFFYIQIFNRAIAKYLRNRFLNIMRWWFLSGRDKTYHTDIRPIFDIITPRPNLSHHTCTTKRMIPYSLDKSHIKLKYNVEIE